MSEKFEEFLNSQHSLKPKSIKLYRLAIQKFNRIAKEPFEKTYLDRKKVHKVLNSFSKEMSDSTWNTYLVLCKRYARWLSDPEDEITPKLWRKIKSKKIDWGKKLKNKYLTKKEFYQFLDVIDYPRDKALFGVAIEGALRSGELLDLKIRDVQKTNYGYDVTVSGKTGSSTFPVVLFAPLLTHWLNFHPFKHDPKATLWPVQKGGKKIGLQENGYAHLIRKYAKKSGLNKRISSHWLRHSKITWTAKNNKVRVSDEMAKKMFRWSKNSTMFSRYTHLHGTDSKETMLALAGIKTKEEEEKPSVLAPKKCLNCNEVNSASMLYCGKCGFILDEEEAKKQVAKQKLIDQMMEYFKEKRDSENKN
jgi:integrase